MEKTSLLFIRACKSRSPWKRVESVYKRFYYRVADDRAIASLLSQVCDKYAPISTKELIDGLNPNNKWMYANDSDSYYETVSKVLISHLRLIAVDRINGWVVPRHFKSAAQHPSLANE